MNLEADDGLQFFASMILAGTIIFGGGPVVIPLLRDYVVVPGKNYYNRLVIRC